MLAIAAESLVAFQACLASAPRSLVSLSRQNPDGWGTAVHKSGAGWLVEKRASCAALDDRFRRLAVDVSGDVLVAHVRQRTVGEVSLPNTHPFHRGSWVFAHNGTVADLDFLRARVSRERRRELGGQTDSELLFAYLLSCLDARERSDASANTETDAVLAAACDELRDTEGLGSLNFVLCNGAVLYAHRLGRPLHVLERHASAERGAMVLVASEPVTDEPWAELADGALLRCDPRSHPRVHFLRGTDPREWALEEQEELPFTD